jgi:hypothetical protein
MNRISEITLGKLLAKIDACGNLSKAVSIFWMEGLDRAGYHELILLELLKIPLDKSDKYSIIKT